MPDEPADIIREAGIFFSRSKRCELFAKLTEVTWNGDHSLKEIISSMAAQIQPYDFCSVDALRRLKHSSLSKSYAVRKRIERLGHACANGICLGREDITKAVAPIDADVRDVLAIASNLIKQDVDGEFHLIDQDALRGWDPILFSSSEVEHTALLTEVWDNRHD